MGALVRGVRRGSAGVILASTLLLSACGSTVQTPGALAPTGASDRAREVDLGIPGGAPTSRTPGGPTATSGRDVVGPARPLASAGQSAVARIGTPMLLGVLSYSLSAVNEGANAGGVYTSGGSVSSMQDVIKSLVDHYNKNGGMAGRRLRYVEYVGRLTDPSYQNSMEAACAKFTQDNHVDVVITLIGNLFIDNYEACLAKARVPNIEEYNAGGTDDKGYATYPTLFTVGTVSINRRITAVLTGLTRDGMLSPRNKLGVIVEDCPHNRRAYAATFEPQARRLGLSVVRRDVSCFLGFGDVGAFESQVSAAVLPFRAAGVDRVTFVSGLEGLALLAFTKQASSQGYAPWYALSSASGIGGDPGDGSGNYPREEMARMVGVGWQPDYDLTADVQASQATRRCRALFAAEGVSGSTKADFALLDQVCAPFFFLEDGMKRSNGRSDGASLVAALEGLGTAHVSPFNLAGATLYDATHHDGPTHFAIFRYQTGCSCFRYSSKPARLA